jgi:mannan endo-1,4-beta-mannosidase
MKAVAAAYSGCPWVSNGVNLQPSYYNNGNVTFGWDVMAKYSDKIKTLRIEIEPTSVTQGHEWIRQAVSHGYNVIATYHKSAVLGSDDASEVSLAGDWWVENYPYLSSAGAFTINMMNEWGSHAQTASSYSSAYNTAITKVRSVYDGYIVLDIHGWGQETRTAAQASPLIQDSKVILSAHVYPNGWNEGAGHSVEAADMDELQSTGRPCIVGEFGTLGEGPVDVKGVVSHALDINFCSAVGWAWNGDGGLDMNMVSPYWYQDATADVYEETAYFWDLIDVL